MASFQRMTEQRRIILETLRNTTSHPTADWVYARVREQLPSISLGTIYRNLRSLAEKGDILRLSYGSGQDRYDGDSRPHYHFRCSRCDSVYDITLPYDLPLDSRAAPHCPGVITEHRLEFIGICADCNQQQERTGEMDGSI